MHSSHLPHVVECTSTRWEQSVYHALATTRLLRSPGILVACLQSCLGQVCVPGQSRYPRAALDSSITTFNQQLQLPACKRDKLVCGLSLFEAERPNSRASRKGHHTTCRVALTTVQRQGTRSQKTAMAVLDISSMRRPHATQSDNDFQRAKHIVECCLTWSA